VSERGLVSGGGGGGGTGEGGRVENGEAKKAFVFETGGEEEEADVEEPRSEKVEDIEDALDPDDCDPPCIGGHSSNCDAGIWEESNYTQSHQSHRVYLPRALISYFGLGTY